MKKLLLLVTLMSVAGFCYGQNSPTDYPEVVPPPPSVASLMRFEEVPVDYYTGQPNIALPLGNISINKHLSYSIGLQYNTQALRVDERSGWTGTGFSMSTGGTISRTIKGLPDELNHWAKGKGIYHNDYYYYSSISTDQKKEFLWNTANGKGADRMDSEQDIYQYSYLGGSGRFIVIKEFGVLKAIITESETNEKINISYNTTTFEITEFEIIDTKGHRYIFNVHNENDITSYTISTDQSGTSTSVNANYMGESNVPNAWYLKQILQSNGEELAFFKYQDVNESYDTPKSSTHYALVNQGHYNYGSTSEMKSANNAMLMPKTSSFHQSITSTQKYVDFVRFRDSSKVKYNLTLGHPEYYASGAKLSSIQILDPNGAENKKIEFDYETTNNDRLFLTEVKEVFGTGNELVYTINYNNKEELPEFEDIHQDVWGYYNGQDSDNYYAVISLADPEKATTGAISSITYPTGGKKEFVFQSNSYGYEGAVQVDPATIPDNRIGQSMGGSLSIDLYTQVSSGAYLIYMDVGQRMKINSNITSSGSAANSSKHRLRFHKAKPKPGVTITTPSGPVNYSNYNINDFQYDTNGLVREFDLVNNNTMSGLSEGWYFIELTTPQVEFHFDPTFINVSFTVNHSTFQLNTASRRGGGIRIKEVLFTDEGVEKRKINYVYMDNPHLDTGGVIENIPQELISSGSFEVNPNTRTYTKGKDHPFITGITCSGGSLGEGNNGANWAVIDRVVQNVSYKVTRDISSVYTPNTKGNYVGYKYVLRKETGNGSELITYISPRDVQIQTPAFTSYPFKTQENLDYKRGKIKKREVFDESKKLLIEETHDYWDVSSIAASSLFTFETRDTDCAWDSFYEDFDHYEMSSPYSPYIPGCMAGLGIGDPTVAITENDINTCFSSGGDITTDTYDHRKGVLLTKEVIKKQFFYNGPTLSHTIVSTDNMTYNYKNRIAEKTTKFNEANSLVTLKQKMFYPYNEPSSEFTTGEKLIFDQMESKNIIEVPIYSQSYRNTDLMSTTKTIFNQTTTNDFQPVNVEVYKSNETKANEIDFVSYDEFGNLQQVSKRDGTEVSYIWGYDKTVPVAKIENATYTQISSYVANIQTLSNNDDDRTSDTVNWDDTITYIGDEGALRQALQNLRAAFPNALITTYTYDPLIGVTSITDPRGQTVYYEYDAFHRLKQVKDAYKKIVSENKYHYKN